MKTNIKIGLGLSLGAMVVALATINAVENTKQRKIEANVRIAEIEAQKRKTTKKTTTTKKTVNNKKNNNGDEKK